MLGGVEAVRGESARALLRLARVGALVALVWLVAVASAAAAPSTTTLTFDDLAEGVTVNDGPGIEFVSPGEAGFTTGAPADGVVADAATCGPPIIRSSSATESPPRYASGPCGPVEIPDGFGTFAVLTNTANRVATFVGDPQQAPGSSTTFELDAYDFNSRLVQRQTVTTTTADIRTPLVVDRPPGVYDIAFFALWVSSPTSNAAMGFDDLSFVTDPSVAPPEINISTSAGGQISQGGTVQYKVSLFRHNGSNGNVALGVTRLPPGVHGAFEPATLTGAATTSALTVSVDDSAPLGSASATITATPGAGAGDGTQDHALSVRVVAPFQLLTGVNFTPGTRTTISVPACGSASTSVRTLLGPGFAGSPVDLALSTSGDTRGISSISLAKRSLANPTDFSFGENDQQLLISRDSFPTSASSFEIEIAPSSGPFVEPASTVEVDLEPTEIDSVTPSAVRTPQALQPGTEVTLKGTGFCPDDLIRFGNPQATARPTFVSADRTLMKVRTPMLATSGRLSFARAGQSGNQVTSQLYTSADSLTVDSYRNVNGYQFHNYLPHITFDQMTQAFGSDQTYDSIPVCIIDCTVTFRDPFAMTLNAIANAVFEGGGGGACFGFSLSSQRFLERQRFLSDFPPGSASTLFDLDGPGNNRSGPITEYINAMQVSQLSTEFLGHYLAEAASHAVQGGAAASGDVFRQIRNVLASGRFPLVALRDGTKGHVVVVYNLEGAPPDWYADVYDSNEPFGLAGDESLGSFHQAQVQSSRIHVDSDGNWTLLSSGLSGDMSAFVVTDPADLPNPPTIITNVAKLATLGYVLFASGGAPDTTGASLVGPAPSTVTQVSDSARQTLFAADGSLNTNPRTRLAGAPFAPLVGDAASVRGTGATSPPFILLPRGETAVSETVTDTGRGPDTHTILGHGFAAQLSTTAEHGGLDRLSVDASGAGFRTNAASKPLDVTLIGAAGKARHVAEVRTTSFRGAGDMLAFTHGRDGLELTHRGKSTMFTITLSALGPHAVPETFTSGPLRIAAGAKAQIGAIRWNSLARSSIRVTVAGRTRLVRNRRHRPHLASIASLTAKKASKGSVSLRLATHLRRLPAGAQLALLLVVRRNGRKLASHLVLSQTPTTAAGFTFHASRRGRYTVTGVASVTTVRGATQSSSSAMRTLHFRV